MIVNWNKFIINEAKIQFFNDFGTILKSMKSPIARVISNLEGEEVDIDFNYLNISDTEDMISFIPDSRVKESNKILYKYIGTPFGIVDSIEIRKRFGIDGPYKAYPSSGTIGWIKNTIKKPIDHTSLSQLGLNRFPQDDICHFVSLEGHDYIITYDFLEQQNDLMDPIKSTPIKIGRLAKKICNDIGEEFSDKDYESFVTEYKSIYELMKNKFRGFEVVSGEDIKKWYLILNYDVSKNSTLQNSCMRYIKCQKFFNIYTENPDVCSLLINKNMTGDKITGRALIWTLRNGKKFLDRIYYSREQERSIFEEYARQNEMYYLKLNGDFYYGDAKISADDIEFQIKLSKWKFDYYPYMDTFKYLEVEEGILYDEVSRFMISDCYFLESQDGGNGQECECCGGSGEVQCDRCEGSGNIDCESCDSNGYNDCEDCEGSGTNECSKCDATGKIDGEECSYCDGKGERKCSSCDGEGNIECTRCDGDGNTPCRSCDGDGTYECLECS